MTITEFYKIVETWDYKDRKANVPKLRELFALSCGCQLALRAVGLGMGDALYNDHACGNMEIQRYAKKVYNTTLTAWWVI